jgi:Ca2+-binding RTX toxin-like protein
MGQDRFVYDNSADRGADTITDFTTAGFDHDLIDLAGRGLAYSSLSITDVTGGALVTIDPNETVLVQWVAASALTADMFVF